MLGMHTYSGVSVWRGWDLARGPAPGVSSHVCLARTEVRVWMGKADPTSAPRGSQHPRSGDGAACFTALDPFSEQGFVWDVI